MKLKVIAVIPAYNEEERIGNVVENTKRHADRVIVVDDGSKDRTAEVAREKGAEVISYEKNRGVGYATRTGIARAIELNPRIVVILDADGQLPPQYIPDFVQKIEQGANYVYGLRDLSNYPLSRKIGNFGLTFLTNLICHVNVKDVECGYRAIDLKSLKKLDFRAKTYEREMDFLYEVWRNRLKIDYVSFKVPKYYPKHAVVRGIKNFCFLIKRRIASLEF